MFILEEYRLKMKRFEKKCLYFLLLLPLLFSIQGCDGVTDITSMITGQGAIEEEDVPVPVTLEDNDVTDTDVPTKAEASNIKDSEKDGDSIDLSSNSGVLDIDSEGRTSPFVPYRERNLSYTNVNFGDLPLPPEAGEMDESINTLISAKVTGILYEQNSPSAIINVMNEDYVVKPGDKIESFEISAITKDYVSVKTGTNVYRAKVGDIVDGELYGTGVYNLGHRFAGTRHPARNEDILFVKTRSKKDSDTTNVTAPGSGDLKDLSLPPIPELSNVLPKIKIKTQAGDIPLPVKDTKQ